MKKFLALLLSVLLICSMSMVVFADDVANDDIKNENNGAGTKEGDVVVKVTDEEGNVVDIDSTYYVTVKWEGLEFHLEVADPDTDVVWDGSAYTISNGAWDHDEATVTVENKSDANVSVSAKWKNSGAVTSKVTSNVTATLNTLDTVVLDNAVDGINCSTVFTATIGDEPTTVDSLSFTVDTIQLTITK